MLLFRSEEHIARWCELWGQPHGGTLTPEQTWQLAQAWYGQDRRETDWRRKTVREAMAVFEEIGMVGVFWELPH